MMYGKNDFLSGSINCNVLLIGKTGTGKSSLANYLFDKNKFRTGKGEPVTGWEENFKHEKLLFGDDICIDVYDSVGLEANNFNEWSKKLEEFLSKKQVISSGNIIPANDIIHVLFYTINAASARVEENEINILKNICSNYKLESAIILTNCDVATEEQTTGIKNIIKKIDRRIDIIRVCSVSHTTRSGKKTEPFGKELALQKILEASYEKVGKSLTTAVYTNIAGIMLRERENTNKKIDNLTISVLDMKTVWKEIDLIRSNLYKILHDIEFLINKQYQSYYDFINNFPCDWKGKKFFNDTYKTMRYTIDNVLSDELEMKKQFERSLEEFKDDNSFEKIKAGYNIAVTVLFLKQKLKKEINEKLFNKVISLASRDFMLFNILSF